MARSRFRVTGRVQGVGFRSWTGRTARALGLSGWVRNLPDGSVELEAQGPDERMDALRDALWQGPMFARVTGVEEHASPDAPGAPDGQDAAPHDFHIRF
ncbi:acylphosphatase [Nitratidesulfovibrio sp. D1]|uniref:acylphosphatase n=1 Tax=Nitratidesulfovibrio sp. D1 TaxID=3440151 RepID=UPI003EBF79C8